MFQQPARPGNDWVKNFLHLKEGEGCGLRLHVGTHIHTHTHTHSSFEAGGATLKMEETTAQYVTKQLFAKRSPSYPLTRSDLSVPWKPRKGQPSGPPGRSHRGAQVTQGQHDNAISGPHVLPFFSLRVVPRSVDLSAEAK